jgi:membrane protein required for colicin V production
MDSSRKSFPPSKDAGGSVTWADYLIIFIWLASGAFGFWRGFAKEAIALTSWLAAIWLAWRFGGLVEPLLGEWTAAPELRIWAARGIILVAILVIGGLIAWFVRALIRHTGLSSTDRALGGLFGVARGLLIVGLGAIAIELLGLDQDVWWRDAKLQPLSDQIAEGIRYYAELGGRILEEQALAQIVATSRVN